jgi:hypothetical protein
LRSYSATKMDLIDIDILLFCRYAAPATLIGWIIYFLLLRKHRKGLYLFLAAFFILLAISGYFTFEMVTDTGGAAGFVPFLLGCAAITSYSLMMFVIFFFVYRSLKQSPPHRK